VKRLVTILGCLACLVLFAVNRTEANPANKRAMERFLGPLLPPNLNSCATCHVGPSAHGAESLKDFPHNEFGDRLRSLGKKNDLRERLVSIMDEDTDGDGFSNRDELLLGSSPAHAEDHPSDRDRLPDRIARYQAMIEKYPWRPFEPVVRPEVPEDIDARILNPIDAFIGAEHHRLGLKPRPPAEKEVLLRRVYLDLIGLTPTTEEQLAFLSDDSPLAYETVVEKLLERPEYGERWGRHWMDVWRYSDWAGYKDALRDSQRHIWHWRDWIIEALNEDKPYDRMVHEMLAGDELAPDDWDTLRATGFLARQFFTNRQQWMDNVVTHTSKAFLGLTIGCAKCHDHMYDPISQEEYYSFRAIFEPYQVRTDRVPGVLDVMKDGIPRAYDASLTAKTYVYERGDERNPIRDQVMEPHPPKALGGAYSVKGVTLPRLAYQPERREFVLEDLLAEARAKRDGARTDTAKISAEAALAALESEIEAEKLEASEGKESKAWKVAAKETLRLQREAAVAAAMASIDSAERALAKVEKDLEQAKSASQKTKINRTKSSEEKKLAAGKKALAAAEKQLKEGLTTKYKSRTAKAYPSSSTGRRSAFARWLTDRGNPLTARVAVNHIWLRHFGQALVPTVDEFGANGREPSMPALLDWLAAEFMEQGWSMKHLHRLIVSSAAYRRSGTLDSANENIDRDNLYLWRMPSRRMEGEIVRDNLLHVASMMDRSFGGPDIDHTQAQTSKRRSLYLRHAHEKLVEFVQIFDGPKVSECYQREESVQPHQALALFNSTLTFEQSRALASRLDAESGDDAQFVKAAFRSVLARGPKEEEGLVCQKFLKEHPEDGRERLIMILFNHNDFVTIR